MTPPMLVLVAEDNEVSREIISHQLQALGCESVCAQDGAEALSAWRAGRFDLLLTDLHMPLLDGFQLASSVRLEETGLRLPIVALTANAIAEEAEQCRRAGMDDCVTKPVTLATLRGVLDRCRAGDLPRPAA